MIRSHWLGDFHRSVGRIRPQMHRVREKLICSCRTVGGGPNATWVINSVNIMQGVAGPPMALMADLYGRRWTLIVFTCSGVAGTFVAGTATSMGQVIAGQVSRPGLILPV